MHLWSLNLFVPLMAAMFFRQTNWIAALASMIAGGSTTIILTSLETTKLPFDLDTENIFWN
ncbi:MAG: hypothetical protein R3A12_17990 [Ignavibacteria bacterium]